MLPKREAKAHIRRAVSRKQTLHLTPSQMDHMVAHPKIPFVSFTGSVANGKRVEKTAAEAAEKYGTFKMVGLELGGKDAAYVRAGKVFLTICIA